MDVHPQLGRVAGVVRDMGTLNDHAVAWVVFLFAVAGVLTALLGSI